MYKNKKQKQKNMNIVTNNEVVLHDGFSATGVMIIDHDGYVGMATTTPNAILIVLPQDPGPEVTPQCFCDAGPEMIYEDLPALVE